MSNAAKRCLSRSEAGWWHNGRDVRHMHGLWVFWVFSPPFYFMAGNSGRQPQEQRRYPVLQVHTGCFRVSVIHRALTWTTGSLTSVRDHSCACVYTHEGLAVSITCLTREKTHEVFLVLLTGFELGSWNVKSDALPIEPPRHPTWFLVLLSVDSTACLSFSSLSADGLSQKQTCYKKRKKEKEKKKKWQIGERGWE